MQFKPFEFEGILGLIDVWRSGQINLIEVIRWNHIRKQPFNKDRKQRKQVVLQHTYGVMIAARVVAEHVDRALTDWDDEPIDMGLVMTAFLVHDHGEGELKRDLPYIMVSDDEAYDEYRAFRKRYEQLKQLDEGTYDAFHQAFLLQRVGEDNAGWPEDAVAIIDELDTFHPWEAKIFTAVEHFDYFLFALEQFLHYENPTYLANIGPNQVPHFDNYAETLPGFSKLWTVELRDWVLHFIDEVDDAFFLGMKGEAEGEAII